MSLKEQKLIKLLRAINEDDRTVCWNKEQWLDNGMNDRQNYWVSIYHKGSCRIELSFESANIDEIILEVSRFIALNKLSAIGCSGTHGTYGSNTAHVAYDNILPFEPF